MVLACWLLNLAFSHNYYMFFVKQHSLNPLEKKLRKLQCNHNIDMTPMIIPIIPLMHECTCLPGIKQLHTYIYKIHKTKQRSGDSLSLIKQSHSLIAIKDWILCKTTMTTNKPTMFYCCWYSFRLLTIAIAIYQNNK